MVCTWREGYQSFPPRKSASLNAKNKSSSVLSNGYYHRLKIWVTAFSCWEEGAHKKGRFLHFLRTKDGSAGSHQLCCLLVSGPSSVLTAVAWWPVGHYLAAARSVGMLLMTLHTCLCYCLLPPGHPLSSLDQSLGLLLTSSGLSTPAILLPVWPVGKHLLPFRPSPGRKHSPAIPLGAGWTKGWSNILNTSLGLSLIILLA